MRFLTLIPILCLVPVVAFAGVDDMRVVVKVKGTVEVSQFSAPRKGLVHMVVWRPLKAGEVLGPNNQVRTGKDGEVWLQLGDEKDVAGKMPTDEYIYYQELKPNSLIRIYSQYLKGEHPKPLVYGKVVVHKVRGKIPAAKYWGPKIYPPKTSKGG